MRPGKPGPHYQSVFVMLKFVFSWGGGGALSYSSTWNYLRARDLKLITVLWNLFWVSCKNPAEPLGFGSGLWGTGAAKIGRLHGRSLSDVDIQRSLLVLAIHYIPFKVLLSVDYRAVHCREATPLASRLSFSGPICHLPPVCKDNGGLKCVDRPSGTRAGNNDWLLISTLSFTNNVKLFEYTVCFCEISESLY